MVAKKSAKAQSGTLPQVPKSIQFNKIESYLSKEKPLKRKTSEKTNLSKEKPLKDEPLKIKTPKNANTPWAPSGPERI